MILKTYTSSFQIVICSNFVGGSKYFKFGQIYKINYKHYELLVLNHMSQRLKLGSHRKKAGVWLLASSCGRHNFCMHCAVVSVAAKTLATKV
jgi:hypothetical protein